MSNFMNSGLSAGMGGPMSLEQYQDFLRGQSRRAPGSALTEEEYQNFLQGLSRRATGSALTEMERLPLPPRSSGFLAGRLGDVFTSEEPPAPAPMPDNVAAMSGCTYRRNRYVLYDARRNSGIAPSAGHLKRNDG